MEKIHNTTEKEPLDDSWYFTLDGKVDGPHTIRDLDVKFRTGELASNVMLWRDGMNEWQAAFKIPLIRQLIQDGQSEVTIEEVQPA